MEQFYAYIYSDLQGLPFYVGKGRNGRAYDHLKRKDHHPMTYKIRKMVKSGEKPDITIIECSSEQLALELEAGLIRCIGRRDLGKGPLLNLTDGGEGTANLTPDGRKRIGRANSLRIHTDETKRKLSKSHLNNTYRLGIPQTEEARKKISIGNKGKKKSQSHCAAIAEANRRRVHTEESRRKQSESMKGRIPWNKGKRKEP